MEKSFKINVDESFEFNLKTSDADKLDLIKLSKKKLHIIHNNKSFNIHLNKSQFYKRKYVITINEHIYNVNISNQLDQLIKQLGLSSGSSKKINQIKAPMPGMILNVSAKEGDLVKEGDTLLILEAMKMENSILAPKDGIIKSVNIKNNETVEKGELMIEMD
ncbi:acetyl-CoA carboxylase biotin carboxyl carrier protein subunit [uncultured Lutibacter sp.]|uniref:acetyl-CoA carboxylase biotin carboxyl carrier protein subunit n=1 Tax=uncultured Lutibacter sp. TaxID=437739 RepID=UPI0026258E2A|nr:acetyl-CoA carboxylase biotin carboxyl carrier protein subunit [uncultured Lutibacter sp.]